MRSSFLSLLVATFAVGAAAQIGAPVIPQQPLVTLSGSVQHHSGDEVRGVITAAILNGWHINSVKPLDDFVIPSELKFDPTTAELVRADFPPHELKDFTGRPCRNRRLGESGDDARTEEEDAKERQCQSAQD